MKTKIVDNGMPPATIQRDITRALAGVWGSTDEGEHQTRIDLGKCALTLVNSGKTVANSGAREALAISSLLDGQTRIDLVPAGGEITFDSDIRLAIMLAGS